MPATMTHAFFSKDVYDIMPTDIKENLNIKRVIMFGQSTDSFIFYNLFSLKSGKKMREFQHAFHTKQSQEFFLNLLRYIKDNNIKDVDTYSIMYLTLLFIHIYFIKLENLLNMNQVLINIMEYIILWRFFLIMI